MSTEKLGFLEHFLNNNEQRLDELSGDPSARARLEEAVRAAVLSGAGVAITAFALIESLYHEKFDGDIQNRNL